MPGGPPAPGTFTGIDGVSAGSDKLMRAASPISVSEVHTAQIVCGCCIGGN